MRSCFLWLSKKWFLELGSTPREDDVKIVEMTTKDLDYDIDLFDKAEAWFERIDYNFFFRLNNECFYFSYNFVNIL